MLPQSRSYDVLAREFRWQVPAQFNIGVEVCDRWAERDPDKLAIVAADASGRARDISYGWLRETSNRIANALVMGVAPRFRYVLLSDLLLAEMSDEQVEAVFAHELGHVAHRHMIWYLVFIKVLILALAAIALALHNGGIIGYLLGRHADALPYRADAPRGLDLYAYETVPRLYGQFLAYALYRWEIIMRESAIFGILGVLTLGYFIDAAITELRLDTAVVLIIVTGLLSVGVDTFSRWLRRRLRVEHRPVRLSAADVETRSARPCA